MQLASPYVNVFELSSTFKLLPPKCKTPGLLRDNFTSHFGRGEKKSNRSEIMVPFILQDEEVSYHREPENIPTGPREAGPSHYPKTTLPLDASHCGDGIGLYGKVDFITNPKSAWVGP
jgi:hypothetical protein